METYMNRSMYTLYGPGYSRVSASLSSHSFSHTTLQLYYVIGVLLFGMMFLLLCSGICIFKIFWFVRPSKFRERDTKGAQQAEACAVREDAQHALSIHETTHDPGSVTFFDSNEMLTGGRSTCLHVRPRWLSHPHGALRSHSQGQR